MWKILGTVRTATVGRRLRRRGGGGILSRDQPLRPPGVFAAMTAVRCFAALALCPILAAVLAGCDAPRPPRPTAMAEGVAVREIDPAKFDTEPKPLPEFTPTIDAAGTSPLRLTLSPVRAIGPDDLSFRVRVENVGREPLDWDKEWVGGLEWQVAVSDGTKFVGPEVLEFEKKTYKRDLAHQKLTAHERQFPVYVGRFEPIEPGKSFVREFSLQSLGSVINKILEPEREDDKRLLVKDFTTFAVPPGAKLIRVRLRYSPRLQSMAGVQKREQLKLPSETTSNALEVSWP
jgi:hypothetical protein